MSGETKISGLLDQPVIAEVTEAFRRRRKSLRARFAVVELRKVVERVGGDEHELVEIILRRWKSPKSVTVRLKVWHDRIGRIDTWNLDCDDAATVWSREGRFAGPAIGKPLMDALDESDAALMQPANSAALDGIWSKLLLNGPVGLAAR